MKPERLDKIIASAGVLSRRDVSKMCAEGKIKVNDSSVKDPSLKVDPESCEITIQGDKFIYKKYVYIMLNKPAGVISSTDGKGEKTVLDLVPDEMKRPGLFPAGRLDKDTVGLVLITNDGEFSHYILSPKHHVKKEYVFKTDSPLTADGISKIRAGSSAFAPAGIEEIGYCEYRITLTEGKYHEIKLLANSAGGRVTYLKRVKIGDLELDPSLPEGKCKEICRNEIIS